MPLAHDMKRNTPKPPDKGSFPLDHDGECKVSMLKYLLCLNKNNHKASECRDQSKDYLECRMSKNLMAKEEWYNLGFPEESEKKETEKKS